MSERKYVYTFSELIDRLSINQIKECKIKDHKKEYAQEIQDILHDIDLIIKEEKLTLTAEMIRAIIVVAQYNLHIWGNEANCRNGNKEGNDLYLSHSLNSIRNLSKNIIQSQIGGRKDYKLDNIEAYPEWVPSGYES